MRNMFKIKRPSFIIFTDKDGTLNLEDKELDNILRLIISMNGIVIPVTGRTVGDILESLKKNKLKIPEILVGDNGANIYSTSQKRFLIKKSIDLQRVEELLNTFMANGGTTENIRLTDGISIYAIDTPDVRAYYKDSRAVRYFKDLSSLLKNSPETTKITLSGSTELMKKMGEYAQNSDFWSDMGRTAFPKKEAGNYRLDVADKQISKGEAVKLITSVLTPPYGYMCIGNGENDFSMFRQAIDDGMAVGVMEDAPEDVKTDIQDYCKTSKKR